MAHTIDDVYSLLTTLLGSPEPSIPYLRVTGGTDADGVYARAGAGVAVVATFVRISDGAMKIDAGSISAWQIGLVGGGSPYWTKIGAVGVEGTYTPQPGHTGNPVVTAFWPTGAAPQSTLDGTLGKSLDDAAADAASTKATIGAAGAGLTAVPPAVWANTTRTLTGTGGAVGPTAGANLAPIAFGPVPPGQTIDLSGLVSYNGQYATVAGTSAIAYTIYSVDGDHAKPVVGHVAVPLTPASVLHDTLQTDGEASNYNFRFRPDPSRGQPFPKPGTYLVAVTFTVGTTLYFCNFRGEVRW